MSDRMIDEALAAIARGDHTWTAWLIGHRKPSKYGQPQYAAFYECDAVWVTDPLKACHFRRREDAEQLAYGEDCWYVTEHEFVWPSPEPLATLRAEVARLRKEAVKWRRIRTPTHGRCCTCQACGLEYDDCRCDLDSVVDDNIQIKVECDKLREEAAKAREAGLREALALGRSCRNDDEPMPDEIWENCRRRRDFMEAALRASAGSMQATICETIEAAIRAAREGK